MGELSVLCFCSVLLFLGVFEISTAAITITPSQSIKDGETVISGGGRLELGFFTAGNSKNRYLGIWYKKISPPTFVWVANRETPITDSSGILKLADGGILTLLNSTGGTVWHSSNSSKSAQNPIAQLLESGNFVVRDENDDNPENIIWQSFDYPCDTFLPGMKLGLNLQTGLDWHLTSWRSNDDPSRGEYTLRLDPRGFPQLVLRSGSVEQFRIGPFGGTPHLSENPVYKFIFASNDKEMYYGYELLHNNSSILTRVVLSQAGTVQRFTWSDRTQAWELYLSAQTDNCDIYASCGAYGSCHVGSSPECQCLKGFVPKPPKAGGRRDGSNGCVRRMPLNCRDGHGSDGFLMHSGIKLPDTRNAQFHKWLNLEGCRTMCLMNCSCTAYSNVDVSGAGGGCFLWFDDLIDIRVFKQNGQDIYVRVASAEIDSVLSGSNRRKRLVVVVSSTLSMGMLLLGLGLALCFLRKKRLSRQGKEDLEIASFDYAAISRATNHFSTDNKLGEGGFGPVYKGTLDGGQEIAVKVLSKDSRQGFDEFKNEVVFITKLQHRNLVKILGCCIQREKMLIYEYMPNKSLDYFIFDKTQSTLLDWPKRFHIIDGIARGLLYLHQDSRLRIIHRDLKLSNILLDYEMNPKISDFGLAKSFGGNETEASTTRVVGTHGYMSPEYAIDGHFSIKSDVFSLGVLVLEIVSGKRNRRFNHPDHYLNLLGHAWKLYNENRLHELIAPSVGISCNLSKVFRTIHVALLCVQQLPQHRPSMPSVVLMLGSDSQLPQPKQPGFYTQRRALDADPSGNKDESLSANGISETLLEAR